MRVLLAALLLACGGAETPSSTEPPSAARRLALASSPYLRQHADDPVDWYPWGDEAFAVAARLERPVLLSIGYSTCHWCHVMAEESFRDPEIAALLNDRYVAVKVDREERPDVDALYMAAAAALGVRGGWPLTVWLTPDRAPYYAATYLPARDGDRGRPVGFLTVLRQARAAFDEQPERIADDTARLVRHLGERMAPDLRGDLPSGETLSAITARLAERYDPVNGGATGRPKFPSGLPLRFLLRETARTGDPEPRAMAVHTLRQVARGALRDHLGGGFHRYAVDARWRSPHFEKMLYDNARLAVAYTEAWEATGDPELAAVAREILEAVARTLTLPEGGFASAIDADSVDPRTGERVEGRYYTWTAAEIASAVGDDAPLVRAWYGVDDGDAPVALHTPHPLGDFAAAHALPIDEARDRIEAARAALSAARATRPAPLRDDKALAGWNGLMIGAYARAALAFDMPEYARLAERAATFVLAHLRVDGRLMRSYARGRAAHPAMLEDHAFLAAGLLDLFEATGDPAWIGHAQALDAEIERRYADGDGGWWRTPSDGETLLARERPGFDGPEPTGSSVHALTLARLAALTADDRYRARADAALRAHGARIAAGTLTEMLLAADWRLDRPREIVIVTPATRAEASPLLAVLARHGRRNRVVAVVPEADVAAVGAVVAPVRDKVARDGLPTAYVCERGVCQAPTTDPDAFRLALQAD